MLIGGQTGTGNLKTSDGIQNNPARQGNQNQLIVDELHGPGYEAAYRGTMFTLANQAAVTTTAGLATTFTGLAVTNPTSSGVNLVLRRFAVGQVAVAVASSVGIMAGSGAAAGTLVPQNCLIGGGVSKATGSASATIATPILLATYGSVGSLATTGYGLQPGIVVDLGGSIIVPPGQYVASYTTAACTSAFVFSFQWEEVPI
jgi:hypothetical protein